jgi:hypothetical protein
MIKTIVVLHQKIWCQQSGKEKIIYGRGSPEMNYTPTIAEDNKQKMFEDALPTTMYQAGYSEIYGLNPDKNFHFY